MTIYVLCGIDEYQQDSFSVVDQRSKVKGFYRDSNEIYQQMNTNINTASCDLLSYANIASNFETLKPMLYLHTFSGIILDSEKMENAMRDLTQLSRQEYEGNEKESARIDKFKNDYPKNRVI